VYVPTHVLKTRGGRPGVLGRALRRYVQPRKVLASMHWLGIERALDLIPNFLWHALKSQMVVWDTPIDWSATQAYLYNGLPQTICMNVAGREAAGCVSPGDYEGVRARLTSALLQATDPTDGGPIFTGVMTREEAFLGRRMALAPDLVFDVRDDAYVVSPADHPSVVWRTHKTRGRHRSSGIYVLRGPAFRPGVSAEARLLDMTPTLLCAAGCAPPDEVDGQVAMDLLSAEAGRIAPRRYDLQVTEAGAGNADTASVEQRLRDLGYM
jgi:predicted AlkP superfamily phosphohydrolase/phosphomutase